MSRLLLAVLLFAQGAVAAYACPAITGTAMAPGMSSALSSMPDCNHMGKLAAMDRDTPNLCLAHCQNGQQISDPSEAPTVLPIASSFLIVALPDPAALASTGRTFVREHIASAASPPHAILHCCFRI